jgi:hypothetical protein
MKHEIYFLVLVVALNVNGQLHEFIEATILITIPIHRTLSVGLIHKNLS